MASQDPLRQKLYDMQNAVNDIRRTLTIIPLAYGGEVSKISSNILNALVTCLNTIEFAVQAFGKEGVGVRPSQADIDSLTWRADNKSRRPLGSFEASVIDAWVKADKPNREILYDAVKQMLSR